MAYNSIIVSKGVRGMGQSTHPERLCFLFLESEERTMTLEGQVRIPSACAIASGIGLTETELKILGIVHTGE